MRKKTQCDKADREPPATYHRVTPLIGIVVGVFRQRQDTFVNQLANRRAQGFAIILAVEWLEHVNRDIVQAGASMAKACYRLVVLDGGNHGK